jgi:putative ABC transport system permease protein
MRLLSRMRFRLRALRKGAAQQDLDDELQFHLEQQAGVYEGEGLSAIDARAAARRDFGSASVAAEACRDAHGVRLWLDAGRDVRFGWRAALRAPGTMAAAILTLALGIGSATSMFSVVDAVLLRPLPFPEQDRLIRTDQYQAPGALAVLREHGRAFDAIGLFQPGVEVNLGTSTVTERIEATVVSDGLLPMLGVQPRLGRTFVAADTIDGSPPVAILGHGLWLRRFASADDVIGQMVSVDGVSRQIVGVLPAAALAPLTDPDIWLPATLGGVPAARLWGSGYMRVLARLEPGVSAEAATADLRRMAPTVRDSYPWRMPDEFGAEVTAVPLLESLVGDVRQRLLLLAGGVAMLLLAACANVATLLLSRALVREREFALRAALGASRRRLLQQLLTESLVLSLIGGAAGLLLAYFGLDLLRAWLPGDVPRLQALTVDWRAVTLCVVLASGTGLVFGALPASRMSRPDLVPFLKANDGGVATAAGRHVLVKGLVVVQLALAVVLVSGSVLLSRSLWNLSLVPPGFDAADVVSASLTPDRLACDTPELCRAFYDRVVERLVASPQVAAVGLGSQPPLGESTPLFAIDVQDHAVAPGAPAHTAMRVVATPGYFDALDMPVLRGRALTAQDRASTQPVIVINEAFAQHFWPGRDPVGKRIRYVWQPTWRTVVGVVPNVRQAGLGAPPPLAFYLPYGQDWPRELTVLIESNRPLSVTARDLRAAVTAASPNVPVSEIRSLRDTVDASLAGSAALLWLVSLFGAVVLLLGAIGTYGVLANTVSARRRELGIRLALGAAPRSVRRLVWLDAARLCGVGMALGIPLSLVAAQSAKHLLFGTSSRDVVAQVAVLGVMIVVALAAAALPAWRASRVDPIRVVRDG